MSQALRPFQHHNISERAPPIMNGILNDWFSKFFGPMPHAHGTCKDPEAWINVVVGHEESMPSLVLSIFFPKLHAKVEGPMMDNFNINVPWETHDFLFF